MLTEFARDQAFTIAWLGLMTMVWAGWAQEAPPRRARVWLGVGSVLGIALTVVFVLRVIELWSGPSALEGRYHWFGLLTLVEVLAAGAGAVVLARRDEGRWIAWWVALVVALHFLPLALLLQDVAVGVLGAVQTIGLLALVPTLRRRPGATSAVAGPFMAATLLLFGVVSALLFWF